MMEACEGGGELAVAYYVESTPSSSWVVGERREA
jgi:hypothetical protein